MGAGFRAEELLDAVGDAVIAIDVDGTIVSWNRAATMLFGWAAQEAIGHPASDMGIRVKFEEADSWEGELDVPRRDGRLISIHLVNRPLFDDGGGLIGIVSVSRDVTERRRSDDEVQAAWERLAFLASASSMLSSLDDEATLARMANLVVPRLADWCSITLLDEQGEPHRLVVEHSDPDQTALLKDRYARVPTRLDAPHGTGAAITSGRTRYEPAVTDQMLVETAQSEQHLAWLRELAISSTAMVPLVASGRVLGALGLYAGHGRVIEERDVRLAEDLARRAAVALHNTRLVRALQTAEREQRRLAERFATQARTLQDSLLPPSLPSVPGLDLASRYHPAGAGIDVGGDFYDVFPVGRRSWGIAIGDVCGKGADAAAMTALVRYTLRAVAARNARPAKVLTAVNDAMVARDPGPSIVPFATAAYGRLTRRSDAVRLVMARGGHTAPVVVRSDGHLDTLCPTGTLLGMFETVELVDDTVDLAPGDTLVLYTDGVTEARGRGGQFGEERLHALLPPLAGRPAEEVAATISAAALAHAGGSTRDDIAILVVRVTE